MQLLSIAFKSSVQFVLSNQVECFVSSIDEAIVKFQSVAKWSWNSKINKKENLAWREN